jgi:hypothetical protein
MITQQFHRVGDQFAFVFPACGRVTPPQLRQDFRFGLLAHKVVHLLGNTDFWHNDSFSPPPPAASGNKTFGADRGQIWPFNLLYKANSGNYSPALY